MVKLVAFDWNGTIIADTQAILKATNYSRSFFKQRPLTLREYQRAFTIPIIKFLRATGWKGKYSVKEHILFHNRYNQLATKVRSRRGAAQLLKWLRKNNIKSVIYSNHVTPEITTVLKRIKFADNFNAILARNYNEDMDHVHARTKGGKLELYIKEKRIRPHEVVTIGDTCEEIDIGHALGFHTVAITGGNNGVPELKRSKPDYVIHNLLDLKKIITEINKK